MIIKKGFNFEPYKEMINKTGKKVQVGFTRSDIINSMGEGAQEYTVTVRAYTNEVLKCRSVDNGLYPVYTDDIENGNELDILTFLIKLNQDKILRERQVFNTSSVKDMLVVKPSERSIILTLQKNQTKTIMNRNSFEQKK